MRSGAGNYWRNFAAAVSPVAMRIFSGIQPTGAIHLGNYLGAIRRWVKAQGETETLICIVDLHAITNRQDPAALRAGTREMAAALIASGIDPARTTLFKQSANPDHAQLAWVLNCIARVGWLDRMTQFKDKAGRDREGASVGLYAYPGAAGGRHPGVSGDARAGRRGPEAAPGAGARHRRAVQPRL